MTLIDTPEAPAVADRFGVKSSVHADDFMFIFHLGSDQNRWPAIRPITTEKYFSDGAESAAHLDRLVAKFHLGHGRHNLSLFEFASGYGMVSRHLSKMKDIYSLTCCDIHPQAIDFLSDELGINSVLSKSNPDDLIVAAEYDVVFALSFFSHAPHRTFGRWLKKLSSLLANDGILIFTTNGRGGYERAGRPPLGPDGYWYLGGGEQKDIPDEDYGSMVASPFYTLNQIGQCRNIELLSYQAASWWSDQDTYVVRKVSTSYVYEQAPITDLPAQGANKEAGTGLVNAIKKQLGLT